MGVITSQQLSNYYDLYRDTEIVFTKEVIKTLNLDPRQVYFKCGGGQWPCILNSASLLMAKIIIGKRGGAYYAMQNSSIVSLRFCFVPQDAPMVNFFVNAKVTEVVPYMDTDDLVVVSLTYNQRAPDDLIGIIGNILEANINAVKRREERIMVTELSKRRLGMTKEETIVFLQNVPRHCILRDVSFSGAKIILLGTKEQIFKQVVIIRFDFIEPRETLLLKGLVVSAEAIEGRADLVVANILFDEKSVPMAYKMRINNYISTVRKSQLSHNSVADSCKEETE